MQKQKILIHLIRIKINTLDCLNNIIKLVVNVNNIPKGIAEKDMKKVRTGFASAGKQLDPVNHSYSITSDPSRMRRAVPFIHLKTF